LQNFIRIVVAIGHPVCVKGVKIEISVVEAAKVVACAFDSAELFDVLSRHACDVLICDYALSGQGVGEGLSMLALVQQRYPAIKLIVLTAIDSPIVLQALGRQGVRGIVSKCDLSEHLRHALHAVWRGGSYFSPRIMGALAADVGVLETERVRTLSRCEVEVVRLFLSGMSVGEIAAKFGRSKQTVSAQKRSAMKKLDVKTDIELVRDGIAHGLAV